MANKPRTHLAWDWSSSTPQGKRGACGTPRPHRFTSHAAAVTCGACRKTLKMADAEQADRLRRKGRAA